MKPNFTRIAAVAPTVNVADVNHNVTSIIACLEELKKNDVRIAVFPEMSLTGYTCADLFRNSTLIRAAESGLTRIVKVASSTGIDTVVGLPLSVDGTLYNCAAVIRGHSIDLIAKTYIPNYSEFYERRWWHPVTLREAPRQVNIGGMTATFHSRPCVISCRGVKMGIEICEDLWTPVPPSSRLALAGATVIANLSASDDVIGKYHYLKSLISQQSARCLAAYIYAGAGYGESSTDLVFDGKAIIAENGRIIAESRRWTSGPDISIADVDIAALLSDRQRITTFADCASNELAGVEIDFVEDKRQAVDAVNDLSFRQVDCHPFVPAEDALIDDRCDEIINIQAAGLARLDFIRCKTLVIGISGGLDSTLALLVAVKTFDRLGLDRKGIIGVTMPGFGTTTRTKSNAVMLMEHLGITVKEISIAPAVTQHFMDIGQDPDNHDVTYENSQAATEQCC